MIYRMLQLHEGGRQWPYNEVVIDAEQMIIEAVVAGRGGDASTMHTRLLEHFGLQANQLPLVSGLGPVRCVRCE